MGNLLLVDDDKNVLDGLIRALRGQDFTCYIANSGEEALELLAKYPFEVVLSDYKMPKMNGLELCQRIKASYPDTIRLMLSGYAEIDVVSEGMNSGAIHKFLIKPCNNKYLIEQITEAFAHYQELMSHKRNAVALEKGFEAILVTNDDNIITSANTSRQLLTGFAEEELIGQPFTLINEEQNASIFSEFNKKLHKQGYWVGQIYLDCKFQGPKKVWLSASTIRDQSKKVRETIYSFIDR